MPDDDLFGTETVPETDSTETGAVTPETEVGSEEVTATPETEVAADVETETPTKPAKLVPLAALHEERERRKELSAKLDETTRQSAAEMGKLQERINIILGAIQQATTAPEPSDDPIFIQQFMSANPGISKEQASNAFYQEEPANYLKWQQENIAKEQASLRDQQIQQQTVSKTQEQFQNFVGIYQTQAQEFSAKTPDFKEAYNFLLSNRNSELQQMGFTDPMQRKTIMQNEEIGIVDQAFRGGVNPAERLYAIAKFRGFKPSTAAVAPATLDQEKKNAAATKSLGSVPGSASTKMTAEVLLSLSDEEFAAATKGNKWQEMFK